MKFSFPLPFPFTVTFSRSLSLLSLGFALGPAVLPAQASATVASSNPDPVQLENFVVTATRTAVSASEAPANVYVTTTEDFAQKNVFRLADVLADVPGLYFRGSPFGATTPGSGQGGISMRGISNTRTLVLVDGQAINSGYSNGVNWSGISLDDVARIEVVPGAFSSLYGGNAMGGVINVISRVPDHREVITHAGYGGGAVTQWGSGVTYRDVIAPGFAFSLGLSYRDNQSYVGDFVIKSPTAGTAAGTIPGTGAVSTLSPTGGASYKIGDKGKRPWDQWNAFGKLYVDVGASGKLVTGYSYDRYLTSYTPYTSYLLNASGQPVVNGTVAFNDPAPLRFAVAETDFLVLQPSSEGTRRYFANYTQLLANRAQFNVSAGHERFSNYYVTARSSVGTYADGPGTLTDSPSTRTDFDAHLTLPLFERHELVAGVALQQSALHRVNSDLAHWRDPASTVSAYYDSSGRSQTWGYYLQDRISVGRDFTVYLGGRFDDWHVHGRATQTPTAAQPALPASNNVYPRRGESKFSPKAALVWRANSALTFHASAGTAFRTPTLIDLYVPGFTTKTGPVGVRVTQADPNLKPETLRTAELGANLTLTGGTKFTLTGYDSDLRDLIYQKVIISGTTNDLNQAINAGAARILGLESTVDQPLGAGFAVHGGLAYTNAKLTKDDATPAAVGRRLGDVPLVTSSAGLAWTHGRFFANGSVRYYSHVYPRTDDINASTVNGVFGAYDAYAVVNLKLAAAVTDHTRVSLAFDNLLDRKYYAFYLQPGRTWFLEVTSKF